MLIVLSPSKTLDDSTPASVPEITQPQLLRESEALVALLRKFSEKKLAELMGISPKLAALNAQRYRDFSTPFTAANARPALLTFRGDVYESMDVAHYTPQEFDFAQRHLRILSGLYGVLRPLDLMQPYRLEMGTRLKNPRGKDLYEFWGTRITEALNAALAQAGTDTLINLASQEYFSAVRPETLKGRILTVQFKEKRGNKLQTIGLLAKKARGMMADYVIRRRIVNPALLKEFTEGDYRFAEDLSDGGQFLFAR